MRGEGWRRRDKLDELRKNERKRGRIIDEAGRKR